MHPFFWFTSFVYARLHDELGWVDGTEAEDLFDYAYQQDASIESIVIGLVSNYKVLPSTSKILADATREAKEVAKWCVDNADTSQYNNPMHIQTLLKPLPGLWASEVASVIAKEIPSYWNL